MVKPVVRDVFFLGQRSEGATEADRQIMTDLRDTLKANHEHCVGMAANMIGYRKRIIIVSMGFMDVVMVNPVILQRAQPYETEEGCLSLDGVRKTKRFRKIKVQYQDEAFQKHTQDYEGEIAQIIQHECDHMDGVII
ncbi:MAG: peptide deformylase [Lachnospiraceae bacterium]|nr:peptide deformylase [Lachnospiraceae bacterium]MBR3736721.1 peptide deformylase [Lachnospiraceae bacterium]MBR6156456.1 peptide deformylase [Lachnospiraceae bacterium]